ncbi:hypothetical protein [Bradyrhizobium mercantei]|uniref:hypothetical protein n=1 Tax=Bradyrhizobium mercantei TaxID=1904807 RepID=UPI001FD9888A|nr:hypothetical protein [Bradyrhizobium mercantei]
MLAEDVAVYADGGGRVPAPVRPLVGLEAAMERDAGLARLFVARPSRLIRYATINGLPGFITIRHRVANQRRQLWRRKDQVS